MIRLSIIVPIFQNELNLPTTIPALLNLGQSFTGVELELIFVDDGSTDQSYKILSDWYEGHPNQIRVVKFTKNFGQISAIQAGLREASGDCVGVISADLQDPPDLFQQMLKHWEEGAKLVIGERQEREDSFFQSIWSNLFWRLVNRYAVRGYPKNGFDFCLIDRCIVDQVNSFNEKNTHIFPLIFSFGYPYKIISYKRMKRAAGKSQWTFSKKIKLFVDTFVAFSYLPIRTISYLGISVSIFSIVYGLFTVVSYFAFGNAFTGWTTLAVLTSMLSGLILFTLGIIGEYLWRILDAVRQRPAYLIERRLQQGTPTR